MSVGAVSESPYAYMDRLMEGGATIHHNKTASPVTEDAAATNPKPNATEEDTTNLFGDDGFGFDDFLDIINPLQHIPLISTLYREITGDELSPGSRIIGGGLFGGGIGLAASVVNSVIEIETGKDVGEHVLALFSGEGAIENEAIASVTPENVAPQANASSDLQAAPGSQIAPTVITPALQAQLNAFAFPTDKITPQVATIETKTISTAPQTPTPAAQLAVGLEWKTQPPNMLKNIEKIRTAQGDNLSADQLVRLLSGFNQAAFEGNAKPAAKSDNSKPERVSDITPAARVQAHQTYDKGSDIAALPKPTNFFEYDRPTR